MKLNPNVNLKYEILGCLKFSSLRYSLVLSGGVGWGINWLPSTIPNPMASGYSAIPSSFLSLSNTITHCDTHARTHTHAHTEHTCTHWTWTLIVVANTELISVIAPPNDDSYTGAAMFESLQLTSLQRTRIVVNREVAKATCKLVSHCSQSVSASGSSCNLASS